MITRPFIAWISMIVPCLAGGDFIRQIQTLNQTPVIYDIPVASDSGQVLSKPLTAEAAIFQLYANVTGAGNTQTLTKLDEKTVGTYLPSAEIEILSQDPFYPPRTRADQPYGVRVIVNGMTPVTPASPGAAQVDVVRSFKLYDSTSYLPTEHSGEYLNHFEFTGNGVFTDQSILQVLPSPDDLSLPSPTPTKVAGEESFTAYIELDNGQIQRAELAKGTIQVWPVATASIQNIIPGKRYFDTPRDVSVAIRDIYPTSVTYAQIYPGARQTGTIGNPIPSSIISYGSTTHQPQNASLALTDMEPFLVADGWYTIEVLTITPFNDGAPEILTSVTFEIKRTLSFQGTLTTME